MFYQEDEISFVEAQNCCVCFGDIVDSTRITPYRFIFSATTFVMKKELKIKYLDEMFSEINNDDETRMDM